MRHGQDIISERVGGPESSSRALTVRRNPEPKKWCKECSKPVPPNRTIDGFPNRSIDMMHTDPDRLFCTMRCAAKFGVAAWNRYRRAA